jgi:GNAT superfamily N-acetyltransferase
MEIRRATESDAEPIAVLVGELADPFFVSPRREGAEAFLAAIGVDAIRGYLASEAFSCHVATSDGRLAGVVAMRDGRHLFHLFVAPAFQRAGLARRLWHLVESEALERDAPDAFTVNASLAAVPVYRRFGFEPDGPMRVREGVMFLPMRLPRPPAASDEPC